MTVPPTPVRLLDEGEKEKRKRKMTSGDHKIYRRTAQYAFV